MDNLGVVSTNTEQVKVQMIVIPESQPILILPLLMIATILAVMLYRRKLINQ